MNASIKKLVCLASALTVLLMTACTGGNSNDTTGVGTSASTEAPTENVPEASTDAPVVKLDYTITVKDQDGEAVEGVQLQLTSGATGLDVVTTNAEGVARAQAPAGEYSVRFVSLPDGFQSNVSALPITLGEDSTAFDFAVQDIVPNGLEDRPFPIIEDETAVTVPAGTTYNYMIVRGAKDRILIIESKDVEVIYNKIAYTAGEDGRLELPLNAENARESVYFALKNKTDAECSLTVKLESVEGSMDNPFVAELDKEYTANVPKGETVYYSVTVNVDGILMVSSASELNNIMMQNESVVSSYTNGGACEYIAVKAGDTVEIKVASSNTSSATSAVSFSLKAFAGNDDDPVILGKASVGFGISAGLSYTFAYAGEGDTLKVESGKVSVAYNGTTYTPDDNGEITVDISANEGDYVVFTVTNTSADAHIDAKISITATEADA